MSFPRCIFGVGTLILVRLLGSVHSIFFPNRGPLDRNDGVVDLFEMAIFGLFSKRILLFSRWVIKRSERTICNVSPDLCVLVKS